MVKVVAEDLGVARVLLQDSPHLQDVRVVHLVRDPRGLLSSRFKTTGDFGPHIVLGEGMLQTETDVGRVCARYRSDLEAARSLVTEYPDRLVVSHKTLHVTFAGHTGQPSQ